MYNDRRTKCCTVLFQFGKEFVDRGAPPLVVQRQGMCPLFYSALNT